MKTKIIIFSALLASISILIAGCATAPIARGALQFTGYLEHQKIPLTCNVIIPEASRSYKSTSMGFNFELGPLFTENVPIALRQVIKNISDSGNAPSDFIIIAHLDNFSVTLSSIFPVVNSSITYELCTNDKQSFKKINSTQSYKSSFGSPRGTELYKMVFLMCLEDLNSQLLEQKDFILSKTTK